MKNFPPRSACCIGIAVLCLVLGFDALLVRAVVVESDWQQERYCQFNAGDGDCQ